MPPVEVFHGENTVSAICLLFPERRTQCWLVRSQASSQLTFKTYRLALVSLLLWIQMTTKRLVVICYTKQFRNATEILLQRIAVNPASLGTAGLSEGVIRAAAGWGCMLVRCDDALDLKKKIKKMERLLLGLIAITEKKLHQTNWRSVFE